jgi:hypothetical protein
VRRTSTILMHWPGGLGSQLRLDGRARDLRTPEDADPVVLAEATMTAGIGPDRVIQDIGADPSPPGLPHLVGARGGGHLRGVLQERLPSERAAGVPLYLLLDDIAGASLIAGFAWSRHRPDWRGGGPDAGAPAGAAVREAFRARMEGICSGFRPGSSALEEVGTGHNVVPVPPLDAGDDPLAWHHLDPAPAVAMRRARRIDVWRQDEELFIDAMFRDTCWDPDGTEMGVHEYSLEAAADARTGLVTAVRAEPRVLPFRECPGAAPNVGLIVGAPLSELRGAVLERIRATDCCTHLNDALRSLAEVPVLAAAL